MHFLKVSLSALYPFNFQGNIGRGAPLLGTFDSPLSSLAPPFHILFRLFSIPFGPFFGPQKKGKKCPAGIFQLEK